MDQNTERDGGENQLKRSYSPKPDHGTEEWHKMRKQSHKEVERRRRETINQAIKELQELVPTAHNNKAQVIRKAAEHIRKLTEKEESMNNKWTLEKIITEQAIGELASSNEKLKSELEKAYREIEYHKSQVGKLVDFIKEKGVDLGELELEKKEQ
ncbi:Cbf1 protein [Martiniozyma asiatica (nom. inval.)]|nr:Cbf1 protein [Martiniozyma asiatica]